MKRIGDLSFDLKAKHVRILQTGDDGLACELTMLYKNGNEADLHIIASWGGGWDHVSVSLEHRTPNWTEMSAVKDLFFYEEECVIQYHPPKSEYVNYHPFCLHLWRPQGKTIPLPPSIFVGPKTRDELQSVLQNAYEAAR
jgi:hypothetical protein